MNMSLQWVLHKALLLIQCRFCSEPLKQICWSIQLESLTDKVPSLLTHHGHKDLFPHNMTWELIFQFLVTTEGVSRMQEKPTLIKKTGKIVNYMSLQVQTKRTNDYFTSTHQSSLCSWAVALNNRQNISRRISWHHSVSPLTFWISKLFFPLLDICVNFMVWILELWYKMCFCFGHQILISSSSSPSEYLYLRRISLELFTKISPSQDSDRQPEKHNPRATAFASIIKMSINASSHNVEEREETFLDSHRESVGSILGTNSSRFHGNLSSKTKQLTNGHGNRSQWTRSESAKLWSPSWLDAEQRNQSAH